MCDLDRYFCGGYPAGSGGPSGVSVVKDPMDFRNQPEHEYSPPAGVGGGSNGDMVQELTSSFYDPVPQGRGSVEVIARGSILPAPKALAVEAAPSAAAGRGVLVTTLIRLVPHAGVLAGVARQAVLSGRDGASASLF